MNIHVCARCEGCGHVTGGYQWEIPWSRWAPAPSHPNAKPGLLRAHPCPDCGGTGALLEMEPTVAELPLASRRGLRVNGYADHVQVVLQAQSMRN